MAVRKGAGAPITTRDLASPIDHLPAGTWAKVRLEDARNGEILALRLPSDNYATALPDVWIWRASAGDVRTITENIAAIKIYGLGPAFLTRGATGDPVWELWRLSPAPRTDGSSNQTRPYPAPAPTEDFGPRFLPADHPANPNRPAPQDQAATQPEPDQLASRRAARAKPRPSGPATGPYRSPRYVKRPPQFFYDQDEDRPGP